MWNVEVDPCLFEGHTEILGDRLGIFAGNVELPCGRIVAVLEPGDRRYRQFVGNAWVVDIERRRKEAIADDAVRACRRIEPNPEQQHERRSTCDTVAGSRSDATDECLYGYALSLHGSPHAPLNPSAMLPICGGNSREDRQPMHHTRPREYGAAAQRVLNGETRRGWWEGRGSGARAGSRLQAPRWLDAEPEP